MFKSKINQLFDRPVIILAAPRSGSSLLFETLSQIPDIWTVGGERHRLIEGLRPLNPLHGVVDSNRLLADNSNDRIKSLLHQRFTRFLRDRNGQKLRKTGPETRLRFLEKTPKNALRQPFLEQVFPGAIYLYLYREPFANISSMMEAWRTGRWITYRRLPGWKGSPWSLLLPPGWQALNGRPLEEICAFQWAATNRLVVEDLSRISADRWMACSYQEFVADPETTVSRICRFTGLQMDDH